MFQADGADADELFEFEDGVYGTEVAWNGGETARRYSADEDDPWDVENDEIAMTEEHLKEVCHWQTSGEVVLANIVWLHHAPGTVGDFKTLMVEAEKAFHRQIEAYGSDPTEASHGGSSTQGTWLGPKRSNATHGTVTSTTPSPRWHLDCAGVGGEFGGDIVVLGDLIVTASSGFNAGLAACGLDGTLKWSCDLTTAKVQSWPTGGATVHDGVVLQPTNVGLHAVEMSSGKPLWTAPVHGINGSSAAVLDGVAFVAARGALIGVQMKDGTVKSQFDYKAKPDETNTPVLVHEGLLYWRGGRWLFALSPDDPQKAVWQREVGEFKIPGPARVGDGICTFEQNGRSVHFTCLDPAGGAERWSHVVMSRPVGSFAADEESLVFRSDDDGRILCYELSDGALRWAFGESTWSLGRSGPVIVGESVLCVTTDEESDKVAGTLPQPHRWQRTLEQSASIVQRQRRASVS